MENGFRLAHAVSKWICGIAPHQFFLRPTHTYKSLCVSANYRRMEINIFKDVMTFIIAETH